MNKDVQFLWRKKKSKWVKHKLKNLVWYIKQVGLTHHPKEMTFTYLSFEVLSISVTSLYLTHLLFSFIPISFTIGFQLHLKKKQKLMSGVGPIWTAIIFFNFTMLIKLGFYGPLCASYSFWFNLLEDPISYLCVFVCL